MATPPPLVHVNPATGVAIQDEAFLNDPYPQYSIRDVSGFLPSSLANLAAWYRFNKGLIATTGGLSLWTDASGNGRHFKATGVTTTKPAVQTDGVVTDGLSQFMETDSFTFNPPCSIYFRIKPLTFANNAVLFDGKTYATAMLFQNNPSPGFAVYAGTAVACANAGLAIGVFGTLVLVLNGASSFIKCNAGAPTTGNPGSSNLGGFTLGSRGGHGDQFANIKYQEIIVRSGADDLPTIEQHMAYLETL